MSKRSLSLLALALLAATHLAFLARVPGFHYDEAWAANFAHRIASESGFRPFEAMSPYASAWGHYVTAAFFSLFGTSLAIDRLSGVFLALSGVVLIVLALRKRGEERAGSIFALLVACSPMLVMNHRFIVEITTFHVFCFGLLCWAAARRDVPLIAIASLLGITSHILFIAPALALTAVYLLNENRVPLSRRERIAVLAALLALAVFFLKVHFRIPEKEKTLALLALTAALFVIFAFDLKLRWARKPARGLVALLAIPSAVFLVFFMEGSWAAMFFQGRLAAPFLIGSTLIAPALAFRRKIDSIFWFFLFTLVITALIAVKPAPRYFEIPLLILTAMAALELSKMPLKRSSILIGIWGIAGLLSLGANYFEPALAGEFTHTSYRFWHFHDSTDDTIPKQEEARRFAEEGCRVDQITGADSRTMEALRFLSIGDWPLQAGNCPRPSIEAGYSPKWRMR